MPKVHSASLTEFSQCRVLRNVTKRGLLNGEAESTRRPIVVALKGGNKMNNYGIQIEVPNGKVKEILDELTTAQETIRRCYDELQSLGVVTIKEKAASGN